MYRTSSTVLQVNHRELFSRMFSDRIEVNYAERKSAATPATHYEYDPTEYISEPRCRTPVIAASGSHALKLCSTSLGADLHSDIGLILTIADGASESCLCLINV